MTVVLPFYFDHIRKYEKLRLSVDVTNNFIWFQVYQTFYRPAVTPHNSCTFYVPFRVCYRLDQK